MACQQCRVYQKIFERDRGARIALSMMHDALETLVARNGPHDSLQNELDYYRNVANKALVYYRHAIAAESRTKGVE